MTGWDLGLIAAVAAMVIVMALLQLPRRKALVMAFPVPFTIASIALGIPVDTTHVVALTVLFGYTVGVWALHRVAGLPLIVAILAAALGFVAVAALLAPRLPKTDAAFWAAVALTAALAIALLRLLPPSGELPERRRVPLSVKVPVIMVVVTLLVWIKEVIGGFMTLFPMVGVLGSYENRSGLWSNVRQIPVVMLTMLPLMVTSRLTFESLGLAASLALGWLPFIAVLVPFIRRAWVPVPPAPDRSS